MVADFVLLQSRTLEADCRAAQSGMQANPKSGIVESLTRFPLVSRSHSNRSRPLPRISRFAGVNSVQCARTWCKRQHSKRDSESARRVKNAERAHPRVIVLFQQLRWQWDQRATMPSTIEQLILH